MTGPLVLEDLPRLDEMVGEFERVAQDGPDKILREVDSWWPRYPIIILNQERLTSLIFRFKQFLEDDKNKTWHDLDTLEDFHVIYL